MNIVSICDKFDRLISRLVMTIKMHDVCQTLFGLEVTGCLVVTFKILL